MLFVALPKPDLVVNQINARAAFRHLIGADNFVEIDANFGSGVRHGQMNDGGVLFKTAPVALVSERLTMKDAQRGKEPPPADEAGLTRRKPNVFDGQQAFVVENILVNHLILGVRASVYFVLYLKNGNRSAQGRIRNFDFPVLPSVSFGEGRQRCNV